MNNKHKLAYIVSQSLMIVLYIIYCFRHIFVPGNGYGVSAIIIYIITLILPIVFLVLVILLSRKSLFALLSVIPIHFIMIYTLWPSIFMGANPFIKEWIFIDILYVLSFGMMVYSILLIIRFKGR